MDNVKWIVIPPYKEDMMLFDDEQQARDWYQFEQQSYAPDGKMVLFGKLEILSEA